MKQMLQRWFPKMTESSKKDRQLARQVLQRADQNGDASADRLAAEYVELRKQVTAGMPCTDPRIVVPAYSLLVAAMRRTLNVNPFEVQVFAGIKLARGCIAEMQTGEGKTFVTAFPAMLFSLANLGVHVMTANAYLAERDHAAMQPVFATLGVQLGLLRARESNDARRAAYECPITYGPDYEFGFDYLRDQLTEMQHSEGGGHRAGLARKKSESATRQRGHAFAIVDEADSVLIDEAGTPLVISLTPHMPHPNPEPYELARQVAESFVIGEDFTFSPQVGVQLLPAAGRRLNSVPPDTLRRMTLHRPWGQYVEQAMFAKYVLRRDVDYVIHDDSVRIVDQNTGRIFSDRTWQAGLHQTVEAKEEVMITAESSSAARISRQRYFQLYKQISGLTGTAASAARELFDVYRVTVAAIPLRIPSRRQLCRTRYFLTDAHKFQAVVEDVQLRSERGQPILIGTGTINQSEELARRFTASGISFQLLNGKQTADEAAVIAEAGKLGALTIATNMAGRGTDIRLAKGVAELGGLHVIGTQRHETERVDRQLIGRCARQGDPGSCQFFVSAEDRLIAVHSPVLARQMQRLAGEDGEIRTDLSAQVRAVQAQAERAARIKRQEVAMYDDWLTDLVTQL